jgi:hypothetical protein
MKYFKNTITLLFAISFIIFSDIIDILFSIILVGPLESISRLLHLFVSYNEPFQMSLVSPGLLENA